MSKNDLTKFQDISPDSVKTDAEKLLTEFEKVPLAALQQLNADYLKLDENKNYVFIFDGMTSFSKDDKEIECVKLIDKDGNAHISGLSLLVNALKKVTELPCMVKIVTKKEVKSGSGVGKYLDMDVYTVPMEKAK